MAKKRTGLSNTLFSGIDPYGQDTADAAPDESRLLALPLTDVRPDPGQPRRLLPGHIQAMLEEQGDHRPQAAMAAWLQQATSGDARLRELRKLADSIAAHGLINPITVRPAPAGDGYWIITGERRYWAHVLLAHEGRRLAVGDQPDPGRIQCLLAPEGITIRAHQLIENISREDINALEKAEGLLALRYELSGVNPGSPDANLVPWNQVGDVLGISKRYRIYLTSVLDLAPEAQAIVAAHNLAEKTIRPIVQKLKKHPELQLEALQQLVAWQQEDDGSADSAVSNKSVQVLVSRLLARRQGRRPRPTLKEAPKTYGLQRNVRRTLRFLNDLEQGDRVLVARDLARDEVFAETLTEMQTLHEQLTDLLRQVDDYQRKF